MLKPSKIITIPMVGWQLWLTLPAIGLQLGDACMFLSNLMFSLAMGGSGSSIRLSCNSLISSS